MSKKFVIFGVLGGATILLIAAGIAGAHTKTSTSGLAALTPAAPTTRPMASIAVPARVSTSAPAPTTAVSQTVTYTVTGTAPAGVDITYGTDSSNHDGNVVPFSVTVPLDSSGDVLYYALDAQLQGGGNVACSISVDGVVIKSGSASGGYNICSAQIGQNPLTGQWEAE